jgi:hypothetical protein
MNPAKIKNQKANLRIWLPKETRKRLIRSYVERQISQDGRLPSERQVLQAIGGDIHTILAVLQEYRTQQNP